MRIFYLTNKKIGSTSAPREKFVSLTTRINYLTSTKQHDTQPCSAQMKHRNYREFQNLKYCFILCNNNKLPSESNSFAMLSRWEFDASHISHNTGVRIWLSSAVVGHTLPWTRFHPIVRPLCSQPPGHPVVHRGVAHLLFKS